MQKTPALLVREVPVQVSEFSLSGCRFTSAHPLDEQTVGRLTVTLRGTDYQDTVQIVRTKEAPGKSPASTIAGLFAWATPPWVGFHSRRGAGGHLSTGRAAEAEPRSLFRPPRIIRQHRLQ